MVASRLCPHTPAVVHAIAPVPAATGHKAQSTKHKARRVVAWVDQLKPTAQDTQRQIDRNTHTHTHTHTHTLSLSLASRGKPGIRLTWIMARELSLVQMHSNTASTATRRLLFVTHMASAVRQRSQYSANHTHARTQTRKQERIMATARNKKD